MENLLNISAFQWIGLFAGGLYIYLASIKSGTCWIMSLISTICIALEDFMHTHLYIDGVLQLFYALLALVGLYYWLSKEDMNASLRVSRLSPDKHIAYFIFVLVVGIPLGYLIGYSFEAAYPVINGIIAGFAVIATFLLIYKILDTWYYWMIINLSMIPLYFVVGAPLFSILYFLYLIQAFYGLKTWNYQYKKRWLKLKPQTTDDIE
jgi:nicotinamide mononucleotide transporter